MKSWEVNDDAWEAFDKAEDMCAGIQAAYEAGIRAAGVAQPEHFECDCVPNLGPSHCHACSDATGGEVEWSNCAAGVAPQPEPEYEYQWGYPQAEFVGFDPYPTYEEALADMQEDGDPQYVVLRRVKAGAWEPAPNQEGERL